VAFRDIRALCRKTRPHIVHTHSSKAGILGRAGAWGARKATPAPRPVIVHTIHGLPFHPYQSVFLNDAWKFAERWAAHRCDAIISVADAMTKQARAAGVGSRDMFTTIYSAMEIAPFLNPGVTRDEVRRRLEIPADRFVYGTIARLQPLKGHDDLMTTAGDLFEKVPNAHLLWIGDGIFRPRLTQMLQEKGWSNRVTMTGLVPPAEVPKLLPAMDALVHPSYREGLARALPQALLAGVPVISYDCDGAGEVCVDADSGRTGYLVRTGDSKGLCEAMVKMASDPAAAKQMGETGRWMCLQRFSTETMVEQIETLYRKLLPGDLKP
jgi:glycosyltransferase involved in cell wall biosynthesis